MNGEFDINTVYGKKLSKEELIRIIENCYDKEFLVTFLPRSKDNADILVRSLMEEDGKEMLVEEESDNVGDIVEEEMQVIYGNKFKIFYLYYDSYGDILYEGYFSTMDNINKKIDSLMNDSKILRRNKFIIEELELDEGREMELDEGMEILKIENNEVSIVNKCICNECGKSFEDNYPNINELNKRIWCNDCVREMCI